MNQTILMVDESKIMRDMVGFALAQAGYTVLAAANGREALKMLDEHDAHCVLADMDLPHMNGVELVKNLREHPRYEKMPCVLLAVDNNDIKKQSARKVGANGWVAKPCAPANLVSAVQKAVAKPGKIPF